MATPSGGTQDPYKRLAAPDPARLAIDARTEAAGSAADGVRLPCTNLVGQPPRGADLRLPAGVLADGTRSRASLPPTAARTDLEAQRIGLVGPASTGLDHAGR